MESLTTVSASALSAATEAIFLTRSFVRVLSSFSRESIWAFLLSIAALSALTAPWTSPTFSMSSSASSTFERASRSPKANALPPSSKISPSGVTVLKPSDARM